MACCRAAGACWPRCIGILLGLVMRNLIAPLCLVASVALVGNGQLCRISLHSAWL